jgi:hypothetical protein
MPSNDLILLDSTLTLAQKEARSSLRDSDFFELFCCEQLLKDYDLSNDQLTEGIIDGGDDGGVDAFYTFVNEELLDDDTELEQFPKHSDIHVPIVQVKQSDSFAETPFDKLVATTSQIFDLANDLTLIEQHYNSKLIEKIQTFRQAYVSLAARHARLRITCSYVAKADISTAHPKVLNKKNMLSEHLQKIFVGVSCDVTLIGIRELLQASQRQRTYTLQLKVLENPISTGEGAYVALASLSDYAAFVTDEKGRLRKYVFESNVRDYQGSVDVNEDIRKTLLEHTPKLNFWWLNNGVTILASKATIAAKTLTLDDVQIVNGLQTTTAIFNYIRAASGVSDSRAVLVRIIESTDSEARDRIIKATNYQTAIPPASLKATDKIQRDIEAYLQKYEWYYDRRKNHYKNEGKPGSRIIGIPYLAQAITAIVLKQPHNSRARPSTLIKNDSDYSRVFDPKYEFPVYLHCIELMKQVDLGLRYCYDTVDEDSARNCRFHIAMTVAIKLLGKKDYEAGAIGRLSEISDLFHIIEESTAEVLAALRIYNDSRHHSIDRIAKSREFVQFLLEEINPIVSELPTVTDGPLTDEDIPF